MQFHAMQCDELRCPCFTRKKAKNNNTAAASISVLVIPPNKSETGLKPLPTGLFFIHLKAVLRQLVKMAPVLVRMMIE